MNSSEKQIMSLYVKKVIDKKMSVPAVFFLEMFKYLSFIFSQSMIVFGPLATIFLNRKKYYQISNILSKRNNIEYFISEIESQSNE
ncbi:MAG: hypothetical protein CMG00_05280 [Candidatus Marinimicrobia bacterium]|nr:hypothetical protein [Candidatus Neomarinimicrobiota bacterium]|tara:strand:- start:3439 stop:3696 length:258 start_codon:yes stop_codon:yes gene_type:complete